MYRGLGTINVNIGTGIQVVFCRDVSLIFKDFIHEL